MLERLELERPHFGFDGRHGRLQRWLARLVRAEGDCEELWGLVRRGRLPQLRHDRGRVGVTGGGRPDRRRLPRLQRPARRSVPRPALVGVDRLRRRQRLLLELLSRFTVAENAFRSAFLEGDDGGGTGSSPVAGGRAGRGRIRRRTRACCRRSSGPSWTGLSATAATLPWTSGSAGRPSTGSRTGTFGGSGSSTFHGRSTRPWRSRSPSREDEHAALVHGLAANPAPPRGRTCLHRVRDGRPRGGG